MIHAGTTLETYQTVFAQITLLNQGIYITVAMTSMQPFRIERAVVVYGGYSKDPWVINGVMCIDGKDFFTLSARDRKFARAIGLDTMETNQFKGSNILPMIMKARDDKVDHLIMEAITAADPRADLVDASKLFESTRGRQQAYEKANVAQVIHIEMPGFTADWGGRYEPHVVHVISTPKRGAAATVELNAETLTWIAAAVHHFSATATAKRSAEEVPLEAPDCKWKHRKNQLSAIYCRYRTADQQWKVFSITPSHFDDDQLTLAAQREAEAKVQAFFEAHHVPLPIDDSDEVIAV
jgi:hypothetical protein